MFGIVLWRATDDNTAVIWCEDHGDLAFFRAESNGRSGDDIHLDAGDLLQFDLTEAGDVRLVENPRVVAEDHYPSLAMRLKEAGDFQPTASVKSHPTPPTDTGRPIVVPFPQGAARERAKRRKSRMS